MKVRDCEPAMEARRGPALPCPEAARQLEKPEGAEAKPPPRARKMVALGFTGVALAGAALAMVMWAAHADQDGHSKTTPETLPNPQRDRTEKQWPGTPEVIDGFLTARSWRDLLPLVADASRVDDIMAWYYSRHEFKAAPGPVRILDVQSLEAEDRQLLRVLAEPHGGQSVWLLLILEKNGWKVDWEVFVNAPAERWALFLRQQAGAVLEVPAFIAQKPAADGYLVKAGVTPDTHEALLLWATERRDLAGAILAKEDPAWQELKGIDYDRAIQAIVRVKMENPLLDPPLVKLDSIIQRGWIRRER